MKRISILLLLIIASLQIFAITNFDEKYFYPNSIVVCFDANAINTTTGDIKAEQNEDGQVQIGLHSFDRLAKEYNFTDIERMFWVKDQKWHDDNGAYPMNIFRVTIKDNSLIEQALRELSNDKNVIFAEFDAKTEEYYIPNDPQLPMSWHIPVIQAPEMWDFVRGDTTVVIGITDSGTKWNHEDLRDNVFINYAEMPGITINWQTGVISGGDNTDNDGNGKVDDVLGWDFFANRNNPFQSFPGNDHGTHVAGCAGAVGDNGVGVAGPAMHIKLLNTKHQSHTQYSTSVSNGYQGIYYTADTGAHIINCSWGGPGGASIANTAINYATAQGALVFAAAGNENRSNDAFPSYPSDATNAVSVASSNQSDEKSDFSNWGSAIDVCAPGSAIRSTIYSGTSANPVDSYAAYQGTSMASPVAAGVGAMIKATHPHFTPAQIKQRLMETCDPMEQNFEGPYAGLLGAGRVNAFRAVMGDLIPNLTLYGNITVEEVEGDGDGVPNIGETISIRVGLGNEVDFLDAFGITATLVSELEGVEVLQETLEFNDILNGMNSYANNTALVHVHSHVSTLELPFTLVVTSNQEAANPYPFYKEIPLMINISMSQPNWPLITGAQSPSSPVVANLDGTGKKLITVVNGIVHLVDSAKNYAPGFPLDLQENTLGQIAVGNVTGDQNLEIVIVTSTGKVKVISSTGQVVNEYNLQGAVRNSPIIADLNNNGQNEIIVGTQTRKVFVLNGSDLSVWPNYPIDFTGVIITNLSVGDVNNDGTKNIVVNVSGNPGEVHVLNPVSGQNIAGFPYTAAGATNVGSSLANLDGDADLEIIFASNAATNCPIFVLKSNGTLLTQTTISSGIRTEIAVVDLNNDGNPEIVFGDNAGNLHVKNSNLQHLPGFPVNVGTGIESSPVFANVNGDGNREIIFGDNSGNLHIVKFNAQHLTGYPLNVVPTSIKASPWIGNFDNDNDGDILLTSSEGVIFIDYKSPVSSLYWNTFRANYGNTANNADPTTPNTDIISPVLANALEQNYPNPFNPETQIKFSLKNNENVKLAIYNVKGQLVKNLVNENKPAGHHSVVWNGVDNNNTKVASGLYFYKIETNSFSSTRKMMLLK